ncbi:BQ5605_C017g08446 [Microbotryum silenes-dioicae]|uniref:BQ5605_C017g08446 protein n=1 Tax=Microbotryum silenes-dioicae TaxID=796604 RepID=A0A2X0LYQ8_9BASI|nr:BQ5605_C017g08446 [Microbotryum silenes-dioicae]
MAFLVQPSSAGVRGMMGAMEHERGAFVVGIFFQTFLLGMVAAQTTWYFRRGSKDPIYFKVLLIVVVSVLSVKSLCNLKTVYVTCLFARYGKRTPPPSPWTDRAAIVLNDIPLIAAQCYLCYRLWVVSLLETHPSHASGTLGHTLFAHFFHRPCDEIGLGKKAYTGANTVWVPGWAFCLFFERSNFLPQITDVYLSAAFAYYALQTRKKAVGHRLDYMLSRLASLAVTTCIPPAIVSAVMAILQIINPSGRSWNFCTVILGALYTVCILHALNARHKILVEARSRSTMKNASPSVTGCKDPSSTSSNVTKKFALRSKKNEEDQTFSGTESAKQIYSNEEGFDVLNADICKAAINQVRNCCDSKSVNDRRRTPDEHSANSPGTDCGPRFPNRNIPFAPLAQFNLRGVQDGATQYVAAQGTPRPRMLDAALSWWSPDPERTDLWT